MKKFAKTASVLAALALLFGAVSCKDNDDPDVIPGGGSNDKVAVESVTIAGDAEVKVDETITLTATVAPATATDKTVTWTSSDETKATVASDGTVKGVAAGEVTITAKAGEMKAEKKITVKAANVVVKGYTYGIGDLRIEFTSDTEAKMFLVGAEDNEKIPAKYTVDGTKIVVTAKKDDVYVPDGVTLTKDVVITGTAEKDVSKITITEVDADAAFNEFCPKVNDVLTNLVHNFVGLSASDFGLASLTKSGTTNLTGDISMKNAKLHSPKGELRVRAGEDSLSTAVNYNGGEKADISGSVTVSSISRYISVPVIEGATKTKITVSYKSVTSDKGSTTCQIGLFDQAGAPIGTVATIDTTKASGSDETATLTANVSTGTTTAYLVFSRNGAGGGGIDVYSIKVE